MYSKSLFIFRRDLRIEDNVGLRTAVSSSEQVIPCFIFTPEQIGPENQYRSPRAIQFMVESLQEVADDLTAQGGRLFIFAGNPLEVLKKLLSTEPIDAVFFNRDYTPYSKKRDTAIAQLCEKHAIDCIIESDALLVEPEDSLTQKGTPYKVFTPFYKKNSGAPVARPYYLKRRPFVQDILIADEGIEYLTQIVPEPISFFRHGGRKQGLNCLSQISNFVDYRSIRNDLTQDTTGLSAHNKFGTVSIREVYHAILEAVGPDNGLLRQLYWRDFFYQIAWFYPQVFGNPFQDKYRTIRWSTNKKNFARWCTGTTGFPLVDTGMRQLNQTGYMHNRTRLVVGSFLTKDLHIDWQWGERYFAQQLTDYDPCVNNGSWQWVASVGCDAQPYFRIFNPWLQQKRYDPDGIYIKRWVPELADLDAQTIHKLYTGKNRISNYPEPMVDHTIEAQKAKEIYKQAALQGNTQ